MATKEDGRVDGGHRRDEGVDAPAPAGAPYRITAFTITPWADDDLYLR